MIQPTLSRLAIAITATLATSTTFAAGLDRSGQDTTAFFQDGTYAEGTYTYIGADVSGQDNAKATVDNISEPYHFLRYAVKGDVNDRVSVAVIHDQPWGAAVGYSGVNDFVSADADTTIASLTDGAVPAMAYVDPALAQLTAGITQLKTAAATAPDAATAAALNAQADALIKKAKKLTGAKNVALAAESKKGEVTSVEVRSRSITGIVGVKVGEKKNFQIYGGPVYQHLEGDISLRGTAYKGANGYDAHISPDSSFGWLGGIAYYKPEMALKAALTYRSVIDHNTKINEILPALGSSSPISNAIEITTPESFNFDFQTGLNQTTLATAKVRYVPWSSFNITPPVYNASSKVTYPELKDGLPLVDYSDDQWQVELGLAKRVHPKLAISGTVGWDSGAGNPTASLGPVAGYYSAGLGAKYNLTDKWAVSAGGKYLWFGDAEAATPDKAVVGNFEDNTGFVAGIKLSYQDKS